MTSRSQAELKEAVAGLFTQPGGASRGQVTLLIAEAWRGGRDEAARGNGAGQAPGSGRLDLIGMLSQLLECTAIAPAECRQLLADCQMCRNSVLYLLDPPMDEHGSRRLIASRVRSLPDTHRLEHGNPASPDAVRPRIRGITT